MEGKLITDGNNNYSLLDYNNELVASTMESGLSNGKLSLKNCQDIENGYDLDELAREACNITDPLRLDSQKYKQDPYFKIGFIKGFQKAVELLGDKKFSEEDMIREMLIWDNHINIHEEDKGCIREISKRVKSLQQTEWDVEIEMSCVIGCENLILNGENSLCCGNKQPKLDSNGCLILKRKV